MKRIFICGIAILLSQMVTSQREYSISVPENPKQIRAGHLNLGGKDPSGNTIAFNSYYMEMNGKPFIPIMGEIHYARLPEQYWEEQILKMKAGGINVIATYVFWNIHEWKEGVFDWSGNKDLRRFLLLCKKHGMNTIVRIGPFCHGEIRNGGIPDWIYGRPFEIRSDNEGYLYYVRRLYHHIAGQLEGLYFKDGGNVIGIQLENELQHSAAPWAFSYPGQPNEMTTADYDEEITRIGVSVQDQQTVYADLGTQHLATLKKIAIDEGMIVPLYTVTGWGMAAVLDKETIPVTAAYPYPFWAEPSMSPFFLFKDIQANPDYSPVRYDGNSYPSFCAEMGVGIQITYARRPRVVAEASEALMLRTLGSGANGIGYYMYHGGLTPQREGGGFFSDEPMGVPKISYDFQAPIGEYGKTRDSYNYLRIIHLFLENFGDQLAPMGVILPETNALITPGERETLRYTVRSNGKSGFIFLNNFQDHDDRIDQYVKKLEVRLPDETLTLPAFTLKKGVSAILPFNLKVGTHLLKYATAQPLAITRSNGKMHYFFYAHEGISPEYQFDGKKVKKVTPGLNSSFTIRDRGADEIIVTTLTREQALHFNQWGNTFCITDATLLQDGSNIKLQSRSNLFQCVLLSTTKPAFEKLKPMTKKSGLFTEYRVELPEADIVFESKKVTNQRYLFGLKKNQFTEYLSDIILDVDYVGDNAIASIDGKMINDHLYYGNSWQIGLKQYAEEIDRKGIYFYFRPMYQDASYLIDFKKDKVPVFKGNKVCTVNGLKVIPEYQIGFSLQ
ncbi:MAG: glycosyl hydrolase family 35 [Methanomicrobiales archaeon]|nr:glycosyl hydrolase family 35 [Methanomicrobiales archaeon]